MNLEGYAKTRCGGVIGRASSSGTGLAISKHQAPKKKSQERNQVNLMAAYCVYHLYFSK